jgi:hypothetical protein
MTPISIEALSIMSMKDKDICGCSGDRRSAHVGDIGGSTACVIYALRPDVCKACLPGDDACEMAPRRFNL